MSAKSIQMHYIVCDGPDCKRQSPGDHSDYTCYDGVDEARETAHDNDWVVDLNGKDYCEEHATLYPCNTRGCDGTVTKAEYLDDIEDCVKHRDEVSGER